MYFKVLTSILVHSTVLKYKYKYSAEIKEGLKYKY